MVPRTIRTVAALAAVAAAFSACAKRAPVVPPVHIIETQRVEVPVSVQRQPPAELMAAYVPEALPEFVAPSAVDASSALTADGERRMRALINDLLARLAAWQEWAAADAANKP